MCDLCDIEHLNDKNAPKTATALRAELMMTEAREYADALKRDAERYRWAVKHPHEFYRLVYDVRRRDIPGGGTDAELIARINEAVDSCLK